MLLLLLLLSAAFGSAGSGDSLWTLPGVPLTRYNNANGARVVLRYIPDPNFVGMTFAITVGAAADPPGLEGLAHVVQHLVTPVNSAEDPAPPGLELGARTTLHHTVYTSLGLRTGWHAQAGLFWKIFQDPLAGLTVDRLNDAREQVRMELATGSLGVHEGPEATLTPFAWSLLDMLIYPLDHTFARAGRGVIRNDGALDRITLDDVQHFVARAYRPSNTRVLVSSALESFEILPYVSPILRGPLVEVSVDELGSLSDLPSLPPPAVPAELNGRWSRVSRVPAPVEHPWLVLGWRLPHDWAVADALFDVIAMRVEGVMAWVLGRHERDRVVRCRAQLGREAARLGCQIEIRPGEEALELLEVALSAVSEVWVPYPPSLDRFERDIVFLRELTTIDSPATAWSPSLVDALDWLVRTGSATWMSDRVLVANASQGEHVAAWASRYVTRERAVAAVLEPGGEQLPGVGTSEEGALRSVAEAARQRTPVVRSDAGRVRNHRWRTLPNGMHVLAVENGVGKAALTLRFDAGARSFPGELGSFALAMVEVPNLTPQFQHPYWSGAVSLTAGAAATELHTTFLPPPVGAGVTEDALHQLRGILDGVTVDLGRKSYWNARRSSAAEPRSPADRARQSRWRSLLQEPSAQGRRPPSWSLEGVEHVLGQVFRPDRAHLVVVGPVDINEVIASVMAAFGDWRGRHPARREALLTDTRQTPVIGSPAGGARVATEDSTAEDRLPTPDSGLPEPPLQVFEHPSPVVSLERWCTLALPPGVHPWVLEQLALLLETRASRVLGASSGAATGVTAAWERLPWIRRPEWEHAEVFLLKLSARVRVPHLDRLPALAAALIQAVSADEHRTTMHAAFGRYDLGFSSGSHTLTQILNGLPQTPGGLRGAPVIEPAERGSARLSRCASESVTTLVGASEAIFAVLERAGVSAVRVSDGADPGVPAGRGRPGWTH